MKHPAATLAALLLALPLVGCQQRPSPPTAETPPFVFRQLQLRQRDPQGRLAWELSSPEARYDLSRKLARTRHLQGLIYAKGQRVYRLSASRGVVLNDGDVVLLEGPLRLERLGKDPLVVSALRLRWYPRRGWMELDRQLVASQKQLRFTAQRARFDVRRDRLDLEGQPRLVDQGQPRVEITLKHVRWWAKSGELQGDGPVRGWRVSSDGGRQELFSPSLGGNSERQELVLHAPVRLLDAGQKAQVRAGLTKILVAQRIVSSDQPFQGSRGPARVSGGAFQLLSSSTTVVLPRGCDLRQAGDQLTADRCSWNWTTEAIQATGRVILRRPSQGLITRAQQLDGRVGADGMVVLRQPAGSVSTTVRIPAKPRAGRRPTPARPPIQL